MGLPVEGIEWIIVIGVVLAMLLWSPEKIPEMARAFGKFMREVQKTRMEADKYVKEIIQPSVEAAEIADRQLIEVARSLDIATAGLRRDEIIALIKRRLESASGG